MVFFIFLDTTSYFTCMNTHIYVIYEFNTQRIAYQFISEVNQGKNPGFTTTTHHLVDGDTSEKFIVVQTS